MSKELAMHIEDLRSGWENTNRAEDRGKYEALLAHAAIVLAKVVLEAPQPELFAAIDTFNRLWGHTWLEYWKPENPDSYELFKKSVGYAGHSDT